MNRVTLSDGRWFDIDASRKWDEGTRWDGSNHISLATGSQWDHQTLYRTDGGAWVIHDTSQWQGSWDTWDTIGDERAAEWLVRNEHGPHEACADAYDGLEVR